MQQPNVKTCPRWHGSDTEWEKENYRKSLHQNQSGFWVLSDYCPASLQCSVAFSSPTSGFSLPRHRDHPNSPENPPRAPQLPLSLREHFVRKTYDLGYSIWASSPKSITNDRRKRFQSQQTSTTKNGPAMWKRAQSSIIGVTQTLFSSDFSPPTSLLPSHPYSLNHQPHMSNFT